MILEVREGFGESEVFDGMGVEVSEEANTKRVCGT
jgi:hypothetical protein